jgi:hypothetical protein
MKKFLIILLGVFSPVLYAQQLTVNMSAEFFPEVIRFTSHGGDWGNINSPLYRGDNTFDFLSTTGEDNLSKPTEVRLALNYNNGRGITSNLTMAFDDYFRGLRA